MRVSIVFIVLLLALAPALQAGQAPAAKVDPQYVWDLSELYPSVAAWQAEREALLKQFDEIAARKGGVAKNAKNLLPTLELIYATHKRLARFYSYASMRSDEDLRVTANLELDQLASQTLSKFGEATAWLEPEILALGERKIRKQLRKDAALAPYQFYLENTLRNAPHTLASETEQMLALFGNPFAQPSNVYSLLANSDIPWPEIKLSDGKSHRMDAQGYGRHRASPQREDRKKTFDAYWSTWLGYRNSVGAVLNSHIQNQVALARARNYDSVLKRELHADNLPEAIYRNLVTEVNNALPTLHRYFKLRAKILGVQQMQYYDIYPPLVELDKTFDFATSKQITLAAMSLLGDEWVARQSAAMDKRWMHVYPAPGKRSGAYMNGSAYDVHPYVLLNHNDDYESLSTLAHEWGHVMHTLYAVESQPYSTHDYAIFIAEIPSTSLELILQNYMVKNAQTAAEKIYYLGFGLENLRGTFFRQTMFAEFELALYEAVERGEALTGEKISAMYGEILKRYHGHDQGVVNIDELYFNEWMFVPHFYYNMYVYQYATSVTAGTALYERMIEQGQAGVDAYIDLLRAGGSDYPHNLLKKAGVDLATDEPFKKVVKRMNLIMDEMEALLAEQQ